MEQAHEAPAERKSQNLQIRYIDILKEETNTELYIYI